MDTIRYTGKFHFDPENVTNKHKSQASWKKLAFVLFDGDVAEYYSWYLEKRYSLVLNKPLRGAHISFINDSLQDIGNGIHKWEDAKDKWHGQIVEVELFLDPRTDGKYWWLNVTPESRELLHGVRTEVGLGKPFFGLHMTVGYANEKNIEHSKYIHRVITRA